MGHPWFERNEQPYNGKSPRTDQTVACTLQAPGRNDIAVGLFDASSLKAWGAIEKPLT